MTLNFNPFPDITTNRLILRRLSVNDVNEVFALRSNEECMKYIPRPICKNTDEALEHINLINTNIDENIGINWAITLKGYEKLIGIIGHYKISCENFRSEIGYMILPEYQNKGYVTEAVKAMLEYGFNQLNLNSIEAIIDPNNIASEKVLQKNGFKKEAHLTENQFYNGRYLDTVIYSILKRNYINIL